MRGWRWGNEWRRGGRRDLEDDGDGTKAVFPKSLVLLSSTPVPMPQILTPVSCPAFSCLPESCLLMSCLPVSSRVKPCQAVSRRDYSSILFRCSCSLEDIWKRRRDPRVSGVVEEVTRPQNDGLKSIHLGT
jgi:hypothetical protein